MQMIDLLGTAAGTLTTLSFLPQVIKTWRSRSADDISTGMFLKKAGLARYSITREGVSKV